MGTLGTRHSDVPAKAKPLTPVFDKARNRWRLSVPRNQSPSGQRQRLYYETKRRAEQEALRIRSMNDQWGTESRKISAALAEDAARASEILGDSTVSLSSLAEAYIEAQSARMQSVTFNVAWRLFRESRETKSDDHQRTLDRIGATLLSEIAETNLRDLTAAKLEAVLTAHYKSAHSFNLALRSINPLFEMGLRKQPPWIDANPCRAIDKRETGRAGPVAIVTVAQAKKLLDACRNWRTDKTLDKNYRVDATDALPAVAIMLFAGVRPKEMTRLQWKDIDLEAGTLFISNLKAKTDRSREIEMPETLIKWLKKCATETMDDESLVVPNNWKRKIQVIRKKAGIATSGRDQLRKSFASYHLRAFEDVNKTRSILGHETDEILFTNYRNAVRKKDAVEFWNVFVD